MISESDASDRDSSAAVKRRKVLRLSPFGKSRLLSRRRLLRNAAKDECAKASPRRSKFLDWLLEQEKACNALPTGDQSIQQEPDGSECDDFSCEKPMQIGVPPVVQILHGFKKMMKTQASRRLPMPIKKNYPDENHHEDNHQIDDDHLDDDLGGYKFSNSEESCQ
jgi:hypothetical protein